MRSKKILWTHFSRVQSCESLTIRPENEQKLIDFILSTQPKCMLARGSGLSYSDSNLNAQGLMIDTQRLNHLIHFDEQTQTLICQGGVLLKDLFLHSQYIPLVLPGTLSATVAGAICHDVHGKNNHHYSSFGHHVLWIDLLMHDGVLRCSREQHADLFYATIGGLGLTGIILQVGLRLKKTLACVQVENQTFDSIKALSQTMSNKGLKNDYQVAWIDLLSKTPRAILTLANSIDWTEGSQHTPRHTIPQLPCNLIYSWNIKLFNQWLFHGVNLNRYTCRVQEFITPLNKITHWNRLYGPKGFIQYQALFDAEKAHQIIEDLLQLILRAKATPTLTVLKRFTQTAQGLLSFCKPGFTLAIDFANTAQARQAVLLMNQYMTEQQGRIYLAKDLLLNQEQFQMMYPNYETFTHILQHYHCQMNSNLSNRLGITS